MFAGAVISLIPVAIALLFQVASVMLFLFGIFPGRSTMLFIAGCALSWILAVAVLFVIDGLGPLMGRFFEKAPAFGLMLYGVLMSLPLVFFPWRFERWRSRRAAT